MASLAASLALWASVSLSIDAAPSTYYVSEAGRDTNPGSAGKPFRTITRGVRGLRPGDTLLVGPGTYPESLYANIPAGSSWAAPVTLRAEDPLQRPVVRPDRGAPRVLHFQGQQYIVVDGFVLDGTNVGYDAVKVTAGGGQPAAHHIRIINSDIKNAPGQCVLTTDGANFNEFLNNEIHDCGVNDFTHGLYISTSNNLIDGNCVYGNAGWGVHVYGRDVNDNIVSGNLVFRNARTGQRGNGIILSSGARNVAINNVLWKNNGGIFVDLHAVDSQVLHNTIVENWPFGIAVRDSLRASVRNNIVYRNGLMLRGIETTASHNLVGSDPLFVNPDAFDFRLRVGSPAIDAGMPLATVSADARGTKRPQGPAADIGAYEYAAGASALPACQEPALRQPVVQ